MTSPTQQILIRQTAKRAVLLLERQQSDRRIADEEQRHSDMLAKTTRLRGQRLAREAAEVEAAEKKANPDRPA